MVINLQKGQTINLEKDVYDLSSVTVELGWDVKESPKGLFSSLLGKKNENDDYDLNAIAFMLDSDGKVARLGDRKMVGGDVVFYNNLRHFTGYVYHTGDNRTGDGEGDAEQIIINLANNEKNVWVIANDMRIMTIPIILVNYTLDKLDFYTFQINVISNKISTHNEVCLLGSFRISWP